MQTTMIKLICITAIAICIILFLIIIANITKAIVETFKIVWVMDKFEIIVVAIFVVITVFLGILIFGS